MKEAKPTIETRALKLEFDQDTRLWSLFEKVSNGWEPLILSAYSQLSLADGRVFRTDDRQASVKVTKKKFSDYIGKGRSLHLSMTQQQIELMLVLSLYEKRNALTIQLAVMNRSNETLRCNVLNLFQTSGDGGVEFDSERLIVNLNSYQSWSESEILELDNEPHTSYWHILLHSLSKGKSLLFGFLTNELAVNSLEVHRPFEASPLQVRSISSLSPLQIAPRGKLDSDKLLLQYDQSPLANLEQYSELLYQFTIRKKKEFQVGKAPHEEIPAGWCSWYYFYSKVTERDVVANLETAAEHFHDLGLRYIQIDDGYQRAAGDWETNEKFPHGHRWLTDQIHRKGFLAGLWIAPFAVGAKSKLYEEHPDWVLKNSDGSPLRLMSIENWGGDVYAVDATIPGVQRWLTDLFRKVTHKWGYDYVKIDFLYFAAQGTQYSKPFSPAQAYRMGLEAIRKGVGAKKFILGCGAPIGISVGLVDGMRIGPDVEASWNGVLAAAASTANRYFYHNRVWFDDPDCLVVREPLTLNQARIWASVVSLCGQMNFLSDDLPTLSEERVNLLRKTLPVYGAGATPVDLLEPSGEIGMMVWNEEGEVFRLSKLMHFNAGDRDEWKRPEYNDSQWQIVAIPEEWEKYEGLENYDGYGWYRLRFYLPPGWKPSDLTFVLGRVDDCDETYFNGKLIGSTGTMPPRYQSASNLFRSYLVPKEVIKWKGENVLAIRVYDGGGRGGIYSLRRMHLPKIWNLGVRKKFGQWNVVGVFNWEDTPQNIEISVEKLGLATNEKYLVYELWTDELLGETEDRIELQLAATSSKVLAIHRAEERPIVISTSRHITHGAIDLEKVEWNEKKKILSGTSMNMHSGEYTLVVWVPPGYQLTSASPEEVYRGSTSSQSLLKVTFELKYLKPFHWKLEFSRSQGSH